MIMDERLNPSPLTPLPQGARGTTLAQTSTVLDSPLTQSSHKYSLPNSFCSIELKGTLLTEIKLLKILKTIINTSLQRIGDMFELNKIFYKKLDSFALIGLGMTCSKSFGWSVIATAISRKQSSLLLTIFVLSKTISDNSAARGEGNHRRRER